MEEYERKTVFTPLSADEWGLADDQLDREGLTRQLNFSFQTAIQFGRKFLGSYSPEFIALNVELKISMEAERLVLLSAASQSMIRDLIRVYLGLPRRHGKRIDQYSCFVAFVDGRLLAQAIDGENAGNCRQDNEWLDVSECKNVDFFQAASRALGFQVPSADRRKASSSTQSHRSL